MHSARTRSPIFQFGLEHEFFLTDLQCSGFCNKLRAPHRGSSLSSSVCRANNLSSLAH
jgi:hypothetical protein